MGRGSRVEGASLCDLGPNTPVVHWMASPPICSGILFLELPHSPPPRLASQNHPSALFIPIRTQTCYNISQLEKSHPWSVSASLCCGCVCAQLCLILWDPVGHSLPGSSVHEIFQARILEWAAISFSRGSSWPRNGTHVSCIGRWIFTTAPPRKPSILFQTCKRNHLHTLLYIK